MDENSKDVITVVAKRTVKEMIEDFKDIKYTSPMYIALAVYGALSAGIYAVLAVVLLNFAVNAYYQYQSFMDEIKFDTLQDEQDRKDAARTSTEDDSEFEEIKPDNDQKDKQ